MNGGTNWHRSSPSDTFGMTGCLGLLTIVTITIPCHQVEPPNPSRSSRSPNLARAFSPEKNPCHSKFIVSPNLNFLLQKKEALIYKIYWGGGGSHVFFGGDKNPLGVSQSWSLRNEVVKSWEHQHSYYHKFFTLPAKKKPANITPWKKAIHAPPKESVRIFQLHWFSGALA